MKSTSVESELHSVSISALVDRHCEQKSILELDTTPHTQEPIQGNWPYTASTQVQENPL